MGQLIKQLHRFVIRVITLSVILATIQPQLLLAQARNSEDFEPPSITVDLVSSGKLGEDQRFSVNVTDNIAVKSVSIFYRFGATQDFQEAIMEATEGWTVAGNAASPFRDEYNVSIPTADVIAASIQYYIQAEDSTGNRSLKGHNFDPLERVLEPGNLLAASNESKPGKKSRTLYYVLGVLAVVVLGAAAAN